MKPDPKSTHVEREFAHDAPLINCRFDPLGNYVFATSEDQSAIRWSLASESDTGDKVVLKKHQSWVRGIAFSPDGKTVVTSGFDDTLIWWPALAEKPEPIREVKAHMGWIRSISTSPDGKLIASAGNDRSVKLWNFADGKLVRELRGHEARIYSTLFHPSGEFLLSGDLKGVVHQWEIKTGKSVRTFEAKDLHSYNKGQRVDYGGIRSLAMTPDGNQLVCAGLHKATNPLGAINEPLVLRFDWKTRALLKSHVAAKVRGVAWRAVFHPEEDLLIGCSGGSGGGYLLFWSGEEDAAFHQFKLRDTVRECDLHPDGLQIATAHHDKKLRISRMAKKAG